MASRTDSDILREFISPPFSLSARDLRQIVVMCHGRLVVQSLNLGVYQHTYNDTDLRAHWSRIVLRHENFRSKYTVHDFQFLYGGLLLLSLHNEATLQ